MSFYYCLDSKPRPREEFYEQDPKHYREFDERVYDADAEVSFHDHEVHIERIADSRGFKGSKLS